MSHTPGPWLMAGDEPFIYALNLAGTNRFWLNVQQGWITQGRRNSADDKRTEPEEIAANARLIAAAPELLAFIKKFSEHTHAQWKAEAAALIAKAEGK